MKKQIPNGPTGPSREDLKEIRDRLRGLARPGEQTLGDVIRKIEKRATLQLVLMIIAAICVLGIALFVAVR